MPIVKDKPPVDESGNCFTCGRLSTDCPVKGQMVQAMLKDTAAFKALTESKTPCAGKSHTAAVKSASMAKALAQGKVKFVGTAEKVVEYRVTKATSSTLKEE